MAPLKTPTHPDPDSSQDDIVEIDGQEETDEEEEPPHSPNASESPSRPKTPAYVAPIPKIGSIPPISPGVKFPPERPKLPPFVGSFLIGKPVDDYGDIVDERTGQVLARAGGDLPSLVGRTVSNREGDILGDNGELLGYVLDVEIERKGSTGSMQSPRSAPPRSLFDLMGRSTASLMVDHSGNILDANGEVVGKFLDNNNPMHRKEKEEREAKEREEREKKEKEKEKEERAPPPLPRRVEIPVPTPPPEQSQSQQPPPPDEERRPRRTEEERRENAEAWRKEKPGESPSDIFLDVKSTTEGIQLTIRIPTVFGGQRLQPNISFS